MMHQAPTATDWSISTSELDQLQRSIYAYSGIVIGPEKQSMVRARLRRRMQALNLNTLAEYLDLVGGLAGATEREYFISALTTNVTSFFREGHHFRLLTNSILPELLQRHDKIHIWSAACSSGQEPYSIAMSIHDALPQIAGQTRILATDIDHTILERAKSGRYLPAETTGIPPEAMKRFLRPSGDANRPDELKVTNNIADMVAFKQVNLNSPWSFRQKFDVIFCRNVAIYFDQTTQRALWRKFHDALRPGGWLLIGHSERIPADLHHMLQTSGTTAYRRPH